MWSPVLVSWPAEHERRADLAAAGVPRVLVVGEGERPPDDLLDDEDWIRLPASEQDVAARLQTLGLRLRASIHLNAAVVRTPRGSARLTAREERVMAVLLEHRGRIAPANVLRDAIGLSGTPDRTLHDVVHRLRKHLRALGFDIFSARARGYTLGLLTPGDDTPSTGWSQAGSSGSGRAMTVP